MLTWHTWHDLLTSPAGSLAYDLVLVFALAGSLQMAWLQWRVTQYPQGARLVRGLAMMLGFRLALFLAQGLAWQGVLAYVWLPPLDRLANVMGILLLVWLWAFPEPASRADMATALGGLALIALAALTGAMTASVDIATFNGSFFDRLWSSIGLALTLSGMALLFLRRPNHALFGGITLAALGFGHLIHLLAPEPGAALAAALRLSELIAYPFLFALLTRYPLPGSRRQDPTAGAASPLAVAASPEKPTALAPSRPAPQQQALHSLLEALVSPTPEERSLRLAQAAAQYLVADMCLLTTPPYTTGQMDVVGGYDLIREQDIPDRSLHADDMPLVAAAIEKGKTLRLPASSTSDDLRTLARWLGLEATGPLLVVPLRAADDADHPPLGALVFLSPYAQHSWTHEEVQRAETFAKAAAQVVLSPLPGHSPLTADLEAEIEALQERLKEAEEHLAASEAQRKMLAERLESAQEHIENLATLLDELENLRGRVKLLEEENRDLKAQLFGLAPVVEASPLLDVQPQEPEGTAPAEEEETVPRVGPSHEQEIEQLQQSLRLALQEVAALKSELALRDQQLLEWERQGSGPVKQTMIYQSLHTLAQDVRQHLSTVIGYTDLLLSESAGLLGQLQREFLERIRHAAHKIIEIVEDAVRLAAMDLGMEPLEAEAVSLADILDAVVAANSEVLRDKRLALRVDLPDTLPALQVNRDALHQIVHNLLRNAALASPPEGDILLLVENQTLPEGEFVLLMVKDSGPGIASDDLPRVFSRIYRTGYRLIEGLGDNGIGLPLVKTLVEALGGRIWVESEPGQGAAFYVLLPIESQETIEEAKVETATDEGSA